MQSNPSLENSLFFKEGSNNIDPLKLLSPVALVATAKRVEPLLSRKFHIDVGRANTKRDQLFIDPVLCCGIYLNYIWVLVHLNDDLH